MLTACLLLTTSPILLQITGLLLLLGDMQLHVTLHLCYALALDSSWFKPCVSHRHFNMLLIYLWRSFASVFGRQIHSMISYDPLHAMRIGEAKNPAPPHMLPVVLAEGLSLTRSDSRPVVLRPAHVRARCAVQRGFSRLDLGAWSRVMRNSRN